jgi:hypothetical protein
MCVECCLIQHRAACGRWVKRWLGLGRVSRLPLMHRAVCDSCLLSHTLVPRRYSTRTVLLYRGDQRCGVHSDQGGGSHHHHPLCYP